MDLIINHKKNTLVLAPDGILDADGGAKLIEAVRNRRPDEVDIVVDGLLWIGIVEEGLMALLQARQEAWGLGRFILRRVDEEILAILELTETIYNFEVELK